MAFGDDKGAIAFAVSYFLQRFFRFVGIHDVFETVFFDVADNPFFTRAVAWRNVSPRVDKEEVGQCAARGTVARLVAAQASVDAAVEICTPIVFQSVFQASAF